MFSSLLRKQLRRMTPDGFVLVIVPIGLVASIVEAHCRTSIGDAEPPEDCSFHASTRLIKAEHVDTLHLMGIVVIPNAVPESWIRCAKSEIEASNSSQLSLFESGNDPDVRQDRIAIIREGDLNQSSETPGLLFCLKFLRGLTYALEMHGYKISHSHRVPQQCQLASYEGNCKTFYRRHFDRCNESIYDLGLLEWLRLSDFRGRSITAILYLNDPEWQSSEGGQLRYWLKPNSQRPQEENCWEVQHQISNGTQEEKHFDIIPSGGTLVIFRSDEIEHMVLPSSANRYAITSWVNGVLDDPSTTRTNSVDIVS